MAIDAARSSAAASPGGDSLFKDAVLDALAKNANVAQFVSFGPDRDPATRFVWVRGAGKSHIGLRQAVEALIAQSVDGRVNVRSFLPEQPRSHEFIYGIDAIDDVVASVERLAASGLYTIVNETIDINDGGVSGVSHGGLTEFAPEDTPRCVEKPGTAALPTPLALALLQTVYGFRPDVGEEPDLRVEFSIHPLRRGYRHEHTIVWEEERFERAELTSQINWPNRFSRFVGDKAFGLLVADAIGLAVPRTTVVSRKIAPFAFGSPTGSREWWIRTAPTEPVPGKFTTQHGWTDPFDLLRREDPDGTAIASVLAQEGVDAEYSGAAASDATGQLTVEGVAGTGEGFMLGTKRPTPLPDWVSRDIHSAYEQARPSVGEARFEWVHDGSRLWIVQLHTGALPSQGRTIYPGEVSREHHFDVELGLEELRELVAKLQGSSDGIVLIGSLGVTSHFGDVLRRARIPSRIEPRQPS
jgi:hypothetical protein